MVFCGWVGRELKTKNSKLKTDKSVAGRNFLIPPSNLLDARESPRLRLYHGPCSTGFLLAITDRETEMPLVLDNISRVVKGETHIHPLDLELSPGSLNIVLGRTGAGTRGPRARSRNAASAGVRPDPAPRSA